MTKVLGLQWITNDDIITYPANIIDVKANTKHLILKQLASIFDPLGVLGPIIIKGKILLQTLWLNK